MKAFVQGLISENACLWSEREAWSQNSGPWGHQLPDGGPREKASWGLRWVLVCLWMVGSLASGGSNGALFGGGAFPGDYGIPPQHQGGPRTSLMEVFNRVSSVAAGGFMQSMLPGMTDVSRALTKAGASVREVSSSLGAGPSNYENEVSKGGTGSAQGDQGQDHGKTSCAPGEATSERDPSVRESGGVVSGGGAQKQGNFSGSGAFPSPGLHGGGGLHGGPPGSAFPGGGGGFQGHPYGSGFSGGGGGLPGPGGGGNPGGGFPGNPGGGFLAIPAVVFLAIQVEAIQERPMQACRLGWGVYLPSKSQ